MMFMLKGIVTRIEKKKAGKNIYHAYDREIAKFNFNTKTFVLFIYFYFIFPWVSLGNAGWLGTC